MAINGSINSFRVRGGVILCLSFMLHTGVQAQSSSALEEIIVTAQRREQSLQEVPVSISAVTSDEIMKMGVRTMEDIESFVPSVEIQYTLHTNSITIRGMGNNVANMSIEQSAPMFVDGITYGRASMISAAMVDVEQIEVLMGPQPVAFGQNATAGAFSVTNKKPTPEWEGDLTAEAGNFGRLTFTGGVGGPINEAWGIRVAGKWDQTDGHLIDAWTGDPFPARRDAVGRVTLQWTPSENFQSLFKVTYMDRLSEGDPASLCARYDVPMGGQFDETSVLLGHNAEWNDRYGANNGLARQFPDCTTDGFTRIGWREGHETRLRQDFGGYNSSDSRSGTFDISPFVRSMMADVGADTTLGSREPMKSMDMLLNLSYELDNGIQVVSNTGMIDYLRKTYEDNEIDPFVNDSSSRVERFDMWSQEIRVRSPAGGMFEWEFGGYYQAEDLDLSPVVTIRPNLSEPVRLYSPWQDPEWKSAFASITYNFWDNKASLDVGGRYSDVHKEGASNALSRTWIFDIDPRDPITGLVRATQHRDPELGAPTMRTIPFATGPTSHMTGGAIIDCGQPHFAPVTFLRGGDEDDPRDYVTASGSPCGNYGAGYYTAVWLSRDIPDAWDGQTPVGPSPILAGFSNRPGPFHDTFDSDSFDPQVTLRYRPFENLSLYAKWAQAFKAGGFDTSDRGMAEGGIGSSTGQTNFSFRDEYATNYEIGARGTTLGNRLRYGVTLFHQEIEDLQIETSFIDLATAAQGIDNSTRQQTNAGLQRNYGVDLDFTWLVSDGLILKLAGVVQRGRMINFIGGCTDIEFQNADSNDCFSEQESLDLVQNTNLAGLIDRAGDQAPRTPDWKVNIGLDYERPLPFWGGNYRYFFNNKLGISDGYTENVTSFEYVVAWDTHVNWNANVGIGTLDNRWQVNAWARNILDTRISYNPEQELFPNGGVTTATSGSGDYFTYGLQLGYKFF